MLLLNVFIIKPLANQYLVTKMTLDRLSLLLNFNLNASLSLFVSVYFLFYVCFFGVILWGLKLFLLIFVNIVNILRLKFFELCFFIGIIGVIIFKCVLIIVHVHKIYSDFYILLCEEGCCEHKVHVVEGAVVIPHVGQEHFILDPRQSPLAQNAADEYRSSGHRVNTMIFLIMRCDICALCIKGNLKESYL